MSFAEGQEEETYSVPKAAPNTVWTEEQIARYTSGEVQTRKFSQGRTPMHPTKGTADSWPILFPRHKQHPSWRQLEQTFARRHTAT